MFMVEQFINETHVTTLVNVNRGWMGNGEQRLYETIQMGLGRICG